MFGLKNQKRKKKNDRTFVGRLEIRVWMFRIGNTLIISNVKAANPHWRSDIRCAQELNAAPPANKAAASNVMSVSYMRALSENMFIAILANLLKKKLKKKNKNKRIKGVCIGHRENCEFYEMTTYVIMYTIWYITCDVGKRKKKARIK